MKSNFSLISLGCARTLVDSEEMVQSMQSVGFKMVPEGTKEEVMVLNTCSFIQAAIDETEANINQLIERKKNFQYVCIVGCYPSRFKEAELTQKYPDVDLWCTTKDEKHYTNAWPNWYLKINLFLKVKKLTQKLVQAIMLILKFLKVR